MKHNRMHIRETETHREIPSPGKQRDAQQLKKAGIKIKSGSDIDQSANTQCYSQDKGHEPPSYPRTIATSIRLCLMGNNRFIKHFTCPQALRLILIFYIINNELCIVF